MYSVKFILIIVLFIALAAVIIAAACMKFYKKKQQCGYAENPRRARLLKKAETICPDYRKRLEYLYGHNNRKNTEHFENTVEHAADMLEKLSVIKGSYHDDLKALYREYLRDPRALEKINAFENDLIGKFPYLADINMNK